MKIGILAFPGGHGDLDLQLVIPGILEEPTVQCIRGDGSDWQVDALLIPAGFPCKAALDGYQCYEDLPVFDRLVSFAESGKLVVGLGNGFRLLCEIGLLPGRLEENVTGRFICRRMYIKPNSVHTPLTSGLKSGKGYSVPIATGSGRFIADDAQLIDLRQDGQILFRYCDHDGRISESVNDTGSADNIAGVCNKHGNVAGLIPLPERASGVGTTNMDGKEILSSFFALLD